MTNFRQKKNLRIRNCKLRISKDCIKIFKTKSKNAFACKSCLNLLHKIGLTKEGYNKMKEGSIKESIEWKDKDNGKMKVYSVMEIKDQEGKVKGTKEENIEVETTFEEINSGLELVKERLNKNIKELDALEKSMEGRRVLNAEQVRLQKNLEMIAKSGKHNESKAKIENLKEQVNLDKEFVVKRSEILRSRPEE